MIFFNDCNTADKLKREFHRLSHLLHPVQQIQNHYL